MQKPRFYSTFFRWLIPYILLIVATICFGVLLYHQALKTVEDDVELLQRASLSRIQEQVDDILDSLDLLGYSITSSMEASALKYMVGEHYSVLQTEHSKSLQEELKIWSASYDVLSEVIVYFPDTGYVLGKGRFCPLEWAKTQILGECGVQVEELKEAADSGRSGFYKRVDKTSSENGLAYFYPSGASWKGRTEAMVLFVLNTSYLKHLLSMPNSYIYLKLPDGTSWLEPEGWSKRERRNAYYQMSQPSKRENLELVSLLETKKYQRTVSVMRWLLGIDLIGGMAAGVAGAWLITRRNYAPVRELRQIAGKTVRGKAIHSLPEGAENFQDDIEAVRAAFISLTKAYEEGRSLLRQEKQDSDNGKMNRLLKQKPKVSKSQAPSGWAEACPEDWFALMSVEILDFAAFAEEDGTLTSEMMETAYFVVNNVLSELVQQEGLFQIGAETDGKWFLLVNVGEEQKESLEGRLEEIAGRLSRVLGYQFAMPVSINISSLKEGWGGVRECYQEIGELLEYRSFSGIEEASVAAYYACLQKIPEEKPEEETSLIDQVASYIEEHYTDNSLTVGALAEQFGVGLSWLSRNFKNQREIGLLEYINRLRLEEAKRIIRAGRPIKEAATAVGYTDTQPLNRMFRQLIGMTPTEYRAQYEARMLDEP